MLDICEQISLKILNVYFKHKRTHQYTWHQDMQELKSIIDQYKKKVVLDVYYLKCFSILDYIIARQNSGLKFQDVRVYRGMTFGSNHYLVNAKTLFSYGKNNANESRENITYCALELSQSPLYNIDSLRDESTSFFYIR